MTGHPEPPFLVGSAPGAAAPLLRHTPVPSATTDPPAVLIHGFLAGGMAYWAPNLPALQEVSRPVVVDLWGHDGGPSPDDADVYTPVGFADALDRLRHHLGIESWVVISHSLGSALAMHYAIRHPDRVLGLVVTNSQSGFATANRESLARDAVKQAARVDRLGMVAFDQNPLNPHHAKRLDPPVKRALIDAYGRHDPAGIARVLRHTVPSSPVTDRLGEIAVPTLLTWGVYEKAFAAGAEVAIDRIPELRVAELAAGHAVNLGDQPGFDRAVTAFVRDVT
ncbi:MAG: alpha/beta fold hydrolase [Acidimicrobiales bacterium]